MRFIVDPAVFRILDGVCFAVVSAANINNRQRLPDLEALLAANIAACEQYFADKSVRQSTEISCYREAFQAMNMNPNKFMCSIEALLTRIAKKKGIPSINPLVDLGNAVSLKYKVPIGAHDLDSTDEDLYVRCAQAGDRFIPFGETASEPVEAGEFVYAAGHSVRTRRWIWRQSELGKITADTGRVLFPIDGFATANRSRLLAAQAELAALLKQYFNCDVQTGWVDAANNSFSVQA